MRYALEISPEVPCDTILDWIEAQGIHITLGRNLYNQSATYFSVTNQFTFDTRGRNTYQVEYSDDNGEYHRNCGDVILTGWNEIWSYINRRGWEQE